MHLFYDPQNSTFAILTDMKEVDGVPTAFLKSITVKPEDSKEYHQSATVLQPINAESLEITEHALLGQLAVLSKVKSLAGIEYPENVIPVDFEPPKKVRKK